MNTIYKSICFSLLAVLFVLSGCEKDDDNTFKGTDNYITSFSLTQGEAVLNATITDSVITVKAPEGFSLAGAKATIKLSENSGIYPDPASITEWDDEILFSVTSYDGTQTQYRYTVDRSNIDAAGSVVLETQADVDAFGLRGITAISGNLIIGRGSGTDSITSLMPLAGLKEIAYSLVINPTYSGEELVGFDNLEKVGDAIQVESVNKLTKVTFPKVKTAGSISIKNSLIALVDFPALTTVTKALTLESQLAETRFPNLKYVGGTLSFNAGYSTTAMLSRISLPSLQEAGNLSFSNFKNATKLEIPELVKVGDLYLYNFNLLSFINAPKLKTASGTITIPYQTMLVEVSFPELTQAKNIILDGKTVKLLEFPKLATVTEKLTIQNVGVKSLSEGFNALTEIKGELHLREIPNMTTFSLPSALKTIAKLSIYNRTTSPFAEINIKDLNVGELELMANAFKDAKIIGKDVFNGTLTLNSDGASGSVLPTFPKLEGFSVVDSLAFGTYIAYMSEVHIKGIKKINKGFKFPNNNVLDFSIADLEEVGGDFVINHLNNSTQEGIEVPTLKKVGGDFSVVVESRSARSLKFAGLASVGGNFTLGTGYEDMWAGDRSLSTFSFPALTSIGGKLKVLANSYGYTNSQIVNMDGFSTLKKVAGIEVTQQTGLISYSGFKNALASFNTDQWIAAENAYNPTYVQLTAGQWTKP